MARRSAGTAMAGGLAGLVVAAATMTTMHPANAAVDQRTDNTQAPALAANQTASPGPTGDAVSDIAQPGPEDIYVAPDGRDDASGTEEDPTTLPAALGMIASGETIYLRDGVYEYAETIEIPRGTNGTADARNVLAAYPGETPVLNFSAQSEDSTHRGLALNADFWHIRGIVVEHAGDNGIFVSGNNNILERTVTRFNRDTGLQLSRMTSETPEDEWPSNNLVLSALSHDNADSDGEDADGFAAKLTSGPGNVFRYSVAHNNIDDGWDLYTKTDTGPIGAVTIENSLALENGTLSDGSQAGNGDRNGLKLGGEDISVDHVITGNVVYGNGKHGLTYNRNEGSMTITNNLSVGSEERNFNFDGGSSRFSGNVSCDSGSTDRIIGDDDGTNAFWDGENPTECADYTGALEWSFAEDGTLRVAIGGNPVEL